MSEKDEITLSIFDQLADEERASISANFDNRHEVIGACGDLMKETIATLRGRGWHTHEPIWNAALFLNTVAFDHSVVLVDLIYERDKWKRGLAARNLALILFEVGEDIPTVFGKRFRDACNTLGVPDEHLNAVGVETKKISAFWKENRSSLKQVRTIAAAHRDHDAINIHLTIDSIDLFGLVGLGAKLGAMLNSLGAASRPIINLTAEVEPPELSTT